MFYFPSHLKYVATLVTTFGNLKVEICHKSGWKKMQTKMSHEPVKFPQLSEIKAMSKLYIYQFYSLSINDGLSSS